MTLIQDQWTRFFDDKFEASHENVLDPNHDNKPVTEAISDEDLETLKAWTDRPRRRLRASDDLRLCRPRMTRRIPMMRKTLALCATAAAIGVGVFAQAHRKRPRHDRQTHRSRSTSSRPEVKDLEKRVMKNERKTALDRINFRATSASRPTPST